jgi:hypothetical protein
LPVDQLNIDQLRTRLRELDEHLRVETIKRGFDPDQIERVALPTRLAALQAERLELAARLEELSGAHQNRDRDEE